MYTQGHKHVSEYGMNVCNIIFPTLCKLVVAMDMNKISIFTPEDNV